MNNYPDIITAVSIWRESLFGVIDRSQAKQGKEYIFHTTGVAEAAALIAEKAGLDKYKAYVLGLLHDWGKIQNERETGIPHFFVGYKEMLQRGWGDVARICLTHSFPEADFDFKDYTSYALPYLQQTKQIISQFIYDDYDRLIQFCDILFEATSKISYQRRIACIRERYGLTIEQTKTLELKAAENKAYFDAKCGCDIYKILDIEE